MSFLPRVFQYAEETGIRFKKVPRFSQWQKLGMPDLRGFTPHLRAVNYCEDQKSLAAFSKSALSNEPRKLGSFWFVHDLLHIIFYDFASMNLGDDLWSDKDRFIECHIASEAFAVLTLDYHFLIKTKLKGLAVDVALKDWALFQKLYPGLPETESFAFCRLLTDFYLSGEGEIRKLLVGNGNGRVGVAGVQTKFDKWLGHEIRYADKQRHYVLAWFEDLSNKAVSGKSVSVKSSYVSEPLWELIGYFHRANQSEWKSFLNDSKKFAQKRKSYFSDLPKYSRKPKAYDFRFTDILALPKNLVAMNLERITKPNGSDLYLIWQILSMTRPSLLSPLERRAILELAAASQSESKATKIDSNAWKTAKTVAIHALDRARWKVDEAVTATFFLP